MRCDALQHGSWFQGDGRAQHSARKGLSSRPNALIQTTWQTRQHAPVFQFMQAHQSVFQGQLTAHQQHIQALRVMAQRFTQGLLDSALGLCMHKLFFMQLIRDVMRQLFQHVLRGFHQLGTLFQQGMAATRQG